MEVDPAAGRPGRGRHLAEPAGLGPVFGALWFGQAVSQLGDFIAYLTIPLLVKTITESASAMGFAYALEQGPTLLFGLLGGVLIDRIRLRPAMIVADLARAAAFFYLAAAAEQPTPKIGVIFVVAFLVGSFSAFFTNSLYVLLKLVVPGPGLARANGLIATSQQATFALGPLIAGIMFAQLGPAAGLRINGATYLVSAISLVLVGRVQRDASEPMTSVTEDAREGFRFLFADSRLRLVTIAVALANLYIGFFESTYVIWAQTVLMTTSPEQIGLMVAASGLGGILGAIVAPNILKQIGLGRGVAIGLVGYGLGFVTAARFGFGVLGLLVFMVGYVGLGLTNVAVATIRQSFVPERLLGRVITASRAIGWATLPIGALIGPALADNTAYESVALVAPALLLIGGLMLIPTIVWRSTLGGQSG